jgi:ComF family protein
MADIDEPLQEIADGLQRQRVAALGQRWRAVALGMWDGFVDLVTPPKCLACRCAVTTGATLCIPCWQTLTFLDEPVCDALGTPFEYDEGDGMLSPAAIADPPEWNKARAALAFDDGSRHLIHLLKYQDTQEAGVLMARMMLGAGRKVIAEADVLMPVPLHRFRLWQRRFNQAAYLAGIIAHQSGKPLVVDVLVRDKRTRQQVGLTAEARRKNVRRAFSIAPEKRPVVDGKTVLLIDDVRTTGATVAACARTLKDSGAVQVHVLTFALVLEPARLHIDV